MKKFKIWFLEKSIKFCNYGLGFSGEADSQEEINEMIASKNYFIRKLRKLTKKETT